ncbi:MAG: M48 family metalloprotease [Candidatus Omnitrophica bacterium]|nr:M48 family metalloprotease [Candidatus Omnitrophota bacterium]
MVFSLHMRLMVLLTIMFALVYAIISVIGAYLGVNNVLMFFIAAILVMLIQLMVSPFLIETTMRVRYVSREEYPGLFQMVESMASAANIPMPRIGIAELDLPNAFAFGRSLKDGRVCVTRGLLNLLNEGELRAVLGHELSHLKNRDVLTISILSVIPMVLYWLYLNFVFGYRRRERNSNTVLIGLAAFIFYLISSLLVLYGSRIREYFADIGSVKLGNKPSNLASALFKLVYGAARLEREKFYEVEGLKAFFASDPSRAKQELFDLKELDLNRSGSIEPSELEAIRQKQVRLSFTEKMLELYSTHPNMLKRIKRLSLYRYQ